MEGEVITVGSEPLLGQFASIGLDPFDTTALGEDLVPLTATLWQALGRL